jgi:hypothetical protein
MVLVSVTVTEPMAVTVPVTAIGIVIRNWLPKEAAAVPEYQVLRTDETGTLMGAALRVAPDAALNTSVAIVASFVVL